MSDGDVTEPLRSALQRIGAVAAWHTRASARRLGVSGDEMLLLQLVSLEPTPLPRLGALLGMSRSGISAMVSRLECAGLIERQTAAHDRRVRWVMLTDETRSRLRQESTWLTSEVEQILGSFDVSAQDVLARFFSAVADTGEAAIKREGESTEPQPLGMRPIPLLWG